jgi:hypothetical protein
MPVVTEKAQKKASDHSKCPKQIYVVPIQIIIGPVVPHIVNPFKTIIWIKLSVLSKTFCRSKAIPVH